MIGPKTAAIVAIVPLVSSAFTISHFSSGPIAIHRQQPIISSSSWALSAAGKGFGDKPSPTKQNTSSSSSPSQSSTVDMPRGTSTSTEDTERQVNAEKNTGSQMLKALRSREAEKRDEELRKVRELRETDALVAQEGAQAQAIPERVAQRMGKRMLPFVGIPLFGSFASFIGFWYLATQKDMEFQPAVVATTSFVFLAIGLLVSYISVYLHKHIASVSYFFFSWILYDVHIVRHTYSCCIFGFGNKLCSI